MKKVFIVLLIFMLSVFVVGCGDQTTTEKDEPTGQKSEEVEKNQDNEQNNEQNETSFMLVDTEGVENENDEWELLREAVREELDPALYTDIIVEDDPEIEKAIETAFQYALFWGNADFKTYTNQVHEFFLTKERFKTDETQKVLAAYEKKVKENEYIIKTVSFEWGKIAFNSAKDKGIVHFYPEVKVVSATPEYFEKTRVEKDKVYSTAGGFRMQKQKGNDEWKIDSFDIREVEDVV